MQMNATLCLVMQDTCRHRLFAGEGGWIVVGGTFLLDGFHAPEELNNRKTAREKPFTGESYLGSRSKKWNGLGTSW